MNKCLKGIHKFHPRYDEVPSGYELESASWCSAEAIRSLMIRNVYIKDVCVRCGKEIKK